MARSNQTPTDPILPELIAIKRLIVFALRQSGVSQEHIGVVLGISQPQVSRTFPFPGGGKRTRHAEKDGGSAS